MNMLYILIPLALMVLVLAVAALLWAIRNRQFDDLESEGWSVVLDDDRKPPEGNERELQARNPRAGDSPLDQ